MGRPATQREYAVRFLSTAHPELLDEVVSAYAADVPQISEAIRQLLTRDRFAATPSRIAKSPSWLALSTLTRPRLKSGGLLPADTFAAVIEMLSFTNPADVYPGVLALREACTADSIARFAWDLFSAWLAEGAPSKDGWAFRAVGWFGDDECARQLTRLIRKWPGEAAHARAVTGLDVLADIGSDVALMNLNGIAEKVKFKGLQDRARDKITEIAEARELSAEELADRLAPDLDLDERGGLDLDFGPRNFAPASTSPEAMGQGRDRRGGLRTCPSRSSPMMPRNQRRPPRAGPRSRRTPARSQACRSRGSKTCWRAAAASGRRVPDILRDAIRSSAIWRSGWSGASMVRRRSMRRLRSASASARI